MESPPRLALASSPESKLRTALRICAVFFFLYVFLVGIGGMGASFQVLGRDWATQLIGESSGPFVSLMIGILATTLVQSSSTTTSMIVGLVGSMALGFEQAVFMVMGANLGTTVTNTLVSLGHITRSGEYKRAFAAATVHDFFNMLTLLVLFPLEVGTRWISGLAQWLADTFGPGNMETFSGPVKGATGPLIEEIKALVADSGEWLLVISIIFLFLGLICMVRSLKKLLLKRLENLFDRILFKTPVRGLLLGTFLTFLVQSSSITTSIAVPLVGAGVISIRQVFPYTLGANIGTTITGILASAAAANPLAAVPVAFFHVLFNVLGVLLIWPIRWLPIKIAESFAELALWNRAVPIVYIIVTFYVLPLVLILILR